MNAVLGSRWDASGFVSRREVVVALLLAALQFIDSARADGLGSWTQRSSPGTNDLFGVVFGNGQFVAVGDNGTILTSADSTNWIAQNSGTASRLSTVRFLNGRFCVVGWDGVILTSTNGTAWNLQSSGVSGGLFDVSYGNGIYVVVGLDSGNGVPLTSPDTVTWTSQNPGTTGPMYSVIFRGGQFLSCVYLDPSSQTSYLTASPDGVTWTNYPAIKVSLLNLAASSSNLVAVGNDPTTGWTFPLMSSPDGNTWSRHNGGGTDQLVGIAYQQQFVAVGGTGLILTSPDGSSWTRRASPTSHFLQAVAFSSQTAIIVGQQGTILQSSPLTPGAPVLSGAYGLGGYRITLAGDATTQYRVQTSPNFSTWTDLGLLGDRQSGAFLLDTNTGSVPSRFYRAMWP